MTSRRPADTTRSPQAARSGGRGARLVINGLLACVIVAGVAFVLLDGLGETDPGSAASHSETNAASAKRHPGVDAGTRTGPPEPTYTLTDDGVRPSIF